MTFLLIILGIIFMLTELVVHYNLTMKKKNHSGGAGCREMMPKEMSKFEFQSVAIFAFDARCLPAYKLLIERAKRASKNTGTLILSTDY